MNKEKCLITYYSRAGNNYVGGHIVNLPVGNTKVAAEMIQKLTGGDMFQIDTVKGYPEDYHKTTDVARQELRGNARPELTGHVDAIVDYSVVYLGYPNWWGTMPMAVCTFLESTTFPAKPLFRFIPTKEEGWVRKLGKII